MTTDPQGMAALILRHEAKPDPHPQYVTKVRGIGEYDPLGVYDINAHLSNPYDGKTYRSLVANNVGNNPASSPTKWERWGHSVAEMADEFIPVRTGTRDGPLTGDAMTRVTNPDGAYLTLTGGGKVGALKIRLPIGNTEAVIQLRLNVFDSVARKSFTVSITGYVQKDFTWTNLAASILGQVADRDLAVRFGNDGTKACVWLGELDSQWNWTRFYVSEAMASSEADGGAVTRWTTGWALSLVTVFNTVGATVTNNLVFGQSDVARVAGLQGALDAKANLNGASFTGPVYIATKPADNTAQLNIQGASGALNNEAKLRFFATFGSGTDLNARFVSSIRSGFNAGTWGKEYLDFCLNNNSANDPQSDANQSRVMRMVSGGRVLIGGGATDDGSNALQVKGNSLTSGTSFFGTSPSYGSVWSDSNATYYMATNHLYVGSQSAQGVLVMQAGGAERARILPSGRVLIGTQTDDGSNALQVSGSVRAGNYFINSQVASDSGLFGFSNANGPSVTAFGSGTTGAGSLVLRTAGIERARINAVGRLLFGTTTDDGASAVQVNGIIKGMASVRALVASNGGGAGQTSMMLTREGAPTDEKSWEFLHGANGTFTLRAINDAYSGSRSAIEVARPSGSGTLLTTMKLMQDGGRLLINGATDDTSTAMQVAGTVSAYYGYSVISPGARQGSITLGNFDGLSIEAYNIGNTAKKNISLAPYGGRVLVGTTSDDGGNALQVAGNVSIKRTGGEGQIALGTNDGYFYGNAAQVGWYSPTKGAFRYDFATQNLFVGAGNNPVWHAGNLTPLDLTKDGTMYGDLYFSASKRIILAEGSTAYPSLTFANDGAPDTGLFHISDGVFGITNNGKETVRFGTDIVVSQLSLTSNALPSAASLGAFRSTANIGGALADWNATNKRIPALQVDAPDAASAYMGLRWTRWAGRHLAAIDAYEGGTTTAAPSIVFHLDGQSSAWTFGKSDITRGAGGSVWGSWNFDPNTKVSKSGDTMTGRLTLTANGTYGELGLRSADNTFMFMRGRASGGGMEWVNSAYNGVPASMDDGGNFRVNGTVSTGGGGSWLAMDGNVYGGIWGGYLSNWLNSNISNLQNNINGKAAINARVQYDSGLAEFAEANGRTNSIVDLPAPYVMTGIRVAVGTDINRIWPRGLVLRNQ
ncbi:hypothetical protein PQR05_29320 [Paraburkholderia sediminicola]|uniref:hypothetical protein n=1 Tax=Paraburkholderia sediminicola TaxID=458836 RepID=UPI0038BD357D